MPMRAATLAAALAATLGAALLFCTPSARAQTTQPAAIDRATQELVARLGDENPKIRDNAAASLRRLGKIALPALQSARHDPDVQVRASARNLADELLNPPKPMLRPDLDAMNNFGGGPFGNGRIRIGNGGRLQINNLQVAGGQAQVRIMNLNVAGNGNAAVREITVNTGAGRTVHIREDHNGIVVDLPPENGGDAKQFKAKTVDELKQNAPEAYKVYEKYLLGGPFGGLKIELGQ